MYYIGIMTGTSLDGIDCILADFRDSKSIKIKYTLTFTFEKKLKGELLSLINNHNIDIKKLGELDHKLGLVYAKIVNKLLQLSNTSANKIIAIGCHGQNIYHNPNGKFPFSMQIGDPNIIASKTKIKVVSDFRRLDIAFGGHGAPLTPTFNNHFFYSNNEARAILNLGGIANITILNNSLDKVIGFDHGPANALLDMWIYKNKNLSFDQNGKWSSTGIINIELLNIMLNHNYFKLAPPKSTGKELFNLNWLTKYLVNFPNLTAQDVQATLLELTVKSISNDINKYANNIKALYLCGGGAKNLFLIERLATYLPKIRITTTKDLGVEPQWMEAVAFAWFAKCRIEQKFANCPSVTGAKSYTMLGSITQCVTDNIIE